MSNSLVAQKEYSLKTREKELKFEIYISRDLAAPMPTSTPSSTAWRLLGEIETTEDRLVPHRVQKSRNGAMKGYRTIWPIFTLTQFSLKDEADIASVDQINTGRWYVRFLYLNAFVGGNRKMITVPEPLELRADLGHEVVTLQIGDPERGFYHADLGWLSQIQLNQPTLLWGEHRTVSGVPILANPDTGYSNQMAVDGSDRGTIYTRSRQIHRNLFRLRVTNSEVSSYSATVQSALRWRIQLFNWTQWQLRNDPVTPGIPFLNLGNIEKSQIYDTDFTFSVSEPFIYRSSGWNAANSGQDRLQKFVYARIRCEYNSQNSAWREIAWVSAPFRVWKGIGCSPDWVVSEFSSLYARETFGDYTPTIVATVPNDRFRVEDTTNGVEARSEFQGRNAFNMSGSAVLRSVGLSVGVAQTDVPLPYRSGTHTTHFFAFIDSDTSTWTDESFLISNLKRMSNTAIRTQLPNVLLADSGSVSGLVNTFDTPNVLRLRNTQYDNLAPNLNLFRSDYAASPVVWSRDLIYNGVFGFGIGSQIRIIGNLSGSPSAVNNARGYFREYMKIVGDGLGNDTALDISPSDAAEVGQYLMQAQQTDAWVNANLRAFAVQTSASTWEW